MAFIKSLAIGKAKGSAQNLTYTTLGGETIVKGKVAFPKNPKTVAQMFRRVKWANIVNMWQAFTNRDKPSFQTKAARVSDFNMFVGKNIGGVPVYLPKSVAAQGGCVVAAYQITEGSLNSIQVSAGTGGVPITDIALGALVIDPDTTLGDFSKAIILNNNGWQDGDQLTFFRFDQDQNSVTGVPYVNVYSAKVELNSADDVTLLSDLVEAYGFSSVDGKVGNDATVNGGCVWVHSRKTAEGTEVSTQTIYVTNAMLADYQTTTARIEAILSYGGKTDRAYLTPEVPAAIGTN